MHGKRDDASCQEIPPLMADIIRFSRNVGTDPFCQAERAALCYIMQYAWWIPGVRPGIGDPVPVVVYPSRLARLYRFDRTRIVQALNLLRTEKLIVRHGDGWIPNAEYFASID
jgi:hypothetical protein